MATQQETVRIDPSLVGSQQNTREKVAPESSTHAVISTNKPVSNTINTVGGSVPLMNGSKQEKLKGSSINVEDARLADGVLIKKVKKKSELEFEVTEPRSEKAASAQGEERSKPSKQSSSVSNKSNIQPAVVSGVEQSS